MNNNPLRYIDPSGHSIDDGDDGGCVSDLDCAIPPVDPPNGGSGGNNSCGGPNPSVVCLPTSTPTPTLTPYPATTPTPYTGPVYTNPPPPQPYLDFDFYVDWSKVDKVDMAIDLIGLSADGIVLVAMIPPLTPIVGPIAPYAEILGTAAEGIGFVKSGIELIRGDPTSMFVQQTTRTAKVIAMGSRFERMAPGVGFIGNFGSLYINLKPQITIQWVTP